MPIRFRRSAGALAIAVAAMAGAVTLSSRQPADTQARVDAIFKRWSASTPGCSVGVMAKGQPLRRAYGMADLEHDVPNTTDTIFEAGSVSKQFTAAAVLLLARDGKLSLDDPVRKYVPELPDFRTTLTIGHMLQHTSGLRDWGSLAGIAGWPRTTRVHTHAHVLDILHRQRSLNFPPGARWSYSNSGYNLAAIIVTRVSGMPFSDFSKTRIFEPLGMTSTSWRDDYTRVVKGRAMAYNERQGTFSTEMPFENVHGNGGLLTTVGDLLKWNENFTAPKVGDAAFVEEMQRRTKFNDGREHEYALGVYVDTFRGVREVDHSGATAGYRAHLSRYPDQGVSVAVLCNVATANATTYAKAVAELYLGDALTPASSPTATHTLTDAESASLVGIYRGTHGPAIAIVSEKGALRIRGGAALLPMSATRVVRSDDGVTLDFDGRGGMRTTDGFGTVDTYERVEAYTPTVEQLKAFTGRYVSDEIETAVDVVIDGDRLVIKRRPDAAIVLTPVFAGGFSGGGTWFRFRRDAANRVIAFSVSQDRVWDLRFVREAAASSGTKPAR